MLSLPRPACWRCRSSRCSCSASWCSWAARCCPAMSGAPSSGPFADQRAVDALNHTLGVDRPLLVQYWRAGSANFIQGDMGTSYIFRAPVAPFVCDALGNSLKLAAVAFVMVVPLGILGGVIAALNVNRPLDRIISLGGLSATVLPEFVTGIILILIFGVWLRWLPISAAWPTDAGLLHPALLSDPAVAAAVPGAVRLHRPHGASRHDRGARFRLHAHRRAQGPALAHGDLAPRAAQRAAADHHA